MTGILKVDTIQSSGGTNTAMTIDSSGRVLTPARPSFYVGKNDDSQFDSNIGDITFNVTTGNFHNSGMFNASNGRATAPVAGLYYFRYHLLTYNANNSAGYKSVGLQKNGSNFHRTYNYMSTANTHMDLDACAVIELAANDYVTVEAINGTFYGGDELYCQFMGYMVG